MDEIELSSDEEVEDDDDDVALIVLKRPPITERVIEEVEVPTYYLFYIDINFLPLIVLIEFAMPNLTLICISEFSKTSVKTRSWVQFRITFRICAFML